MGKVTRFESVMDRRPKVPGSGMPQGRAPVQCRDYFGLTDLELKQKKLGEELMKPETTLLEFDHEQIGVGQVQQDLARSLLLKHRIAEGTIELTQD